MSDLIDRQAAIDAVHQEFDECLVLDESGEATANEVENILWRLPSAQPEQTDCDYCHEDSDGFVMPIEKNSHAVIYGSVLHIKAKGWNGKVQIKYCPMCGRRLTDG